MKRDAFLENILTRFVKSLEDHGKDWVKPWLGSSNLQPPINATTGYQYSGLNWFNLIATADAKGFTSNRWATYNQWKKVGRASAVPKGNGGYVVKFEKGFNPETEEAYAYTKTYPVWNEAQLLDYVEPTPPAKKNLVTQHQDCEAFIRLVNANVQYGGSQVLVMCQLLIQYICQKLMSLLIHQMQQQHKVSIQLSCMSMSIGQAMKADWID